MIWILCVVCCVLKESKNAKRLQLEGDGYSDAYIHHYCHLPVFAFVFLNRVCKVHTVGNWKLPKKEIGI